MTQSHVLSHRSVSRPVSRRTRRLVAGGCIVAALSFQACSGGDGASDTAGAGNATAGAAPPAAAASSWTGRYALRGTIEGTRQAAGTLAVTTLEPGSAAHDSTHQRVRRTYPDYAGPLYHADLVLAAGDTTRSGFTCANNPATPPSLVCHPTVPIIGLRDAALVVQPDGRATLSGSHGEGVTVEYGRFTWERVSGD